MFEGVDESIIPEKFQNLKLANNDDDDDDDDNNDEDKDDNDED